MRFVDVDYSPTRFDTERDTPNERIVHTKHGFDVKLTRDDPYGFIYIKWNSGATPAVISGAFTSFDNALTALNSYLSTQTFNGIVDKPVEKPVLVTKKKFKEGI